MTDPGFFHAMVSDELRCCLGSECHQPRRSHAAVPVAGGPMEDLCVCAGQSWHSSSFTLSQPWFCEAVWPVLCASPFLSLLISPEKTFQVMESCWTSSVPLEKMQILP